VETDLLTELIRRRHDKLLELRNLSRLQMEHARAGETNALLGVLAAKQALLAELQETDRRLDPFRAQDPEARHWRTPADRRRCQETASACAALLGEIMLLEKHSEADMLRRRDEASRQLQGAHVGDQARQGYARAAIPPKGSLDISSDS
jgi:hypothetical protein